MKAFPKITDWNLSSVMPRRLFAGLALAIGCMTVSIPILAPTTALASAERQGNFSAPLPSPTPTLALDKWLPQPTPSVIPKQEGAQTTMPSLPPSLRQSGALLPADTGSYFSDFSSYPLDETPGDWSWYLRGDAWAPHIIHFGGGITDEFKRLEIRDQLVDNGENWLIKNDVYYGPTSEVETIVNFQTADAGMAGVVLGWKDENNFTAVLLDQVNDTVWIVTYHNGEPVWENNGIGSTPLDINIDYYLIAFESSVLERGMGYIDVWLDWSYVYSSAQPIDLRGRAGVGAAGGFPRVIFDNFSVYGELLPDPTTYWTAPGENGATVDVYGDQIQLSASATNDITIWRVRFWRYDETNSWMLIAEFEGPPPYESLFNTGEINFGLNELQVEIETVNQRLIWDAYLWLNRLREPQQFTIPTEGPTLTADGQSTDQIIVSVSDRGGNPLPEVPVSFTGENVSVEPATALTDSSGQAIVTVTAGTVAGTGKVMIVVTPGVLEGEVPVTLVAGAASSLQLSTIEKQLLADGADATDVTATLQDAFGNPIVGAGVSFTATLGTIDGSAVTSDVGKATVKFVAGTSVGDAQISAGYAGLVATAALPLVAGPPAQLTMQIIPATLYADGVSRGDVRAKVTDAYAHPLSGKRVFFTASQGTIDASAVTNAQGEAIANLTAGSSVGSAQIQATLEKLTASATVKFVAGPATNLQLNSSVSEVIVKPDTQVFIMVSVRDAQDRPLVGAAVAFSTTLGSITPLAVTDNNGTATAVLTPDGAVGQARITASINGVSTTMEVKLKGSAASLYLPLVQSATPAQHDEPLVLVNGFFDEGVNSGWSQLVDGRADKLIFHQSDNEAIPAPVSAPYVAWLGGKASQVNQLYQSVQLPSSYSVSIEFMYYTESAEKDCTHDLADLEAIAAGASQPLQNILLCAPSQTQGWRKSTVDLASWRGQSVTLQFRSSLDAQKMSNLFLDNVGFCSSDPGAPAAMTDCSSQ